MGIPLKKTLHKILLLINGLLVFGILLAYLCVYISPEKLWVPALFGLAYTILLLLNLLMIIAWSIRKNVYFLLSLIAILLGWGHLRNYIQIPDRTSQSISEPLHDSLTREKTGNILPVSFLSYNVRLFDHYRWSDSPEAGQKIVDLIIDIKPEILCLQEIYIPVAEKIPELISTGDQPGYPYSHILHAPANKENSNYGIAIFSAFPIINQGEIRFQDSHNLVIYTDLKIRHDTIRVYNNHLQSVRLRKKDYDLMKLINSGEDETMNDIKDISYRLKYAFRKRARQADLLSTHIESSPYPVIVCGDFNDTPVSYSYRKIKNDLVDAFTHSGKGTGKTYSDVFPSYRIDYIFHSEEIVSMGFNTIKVNYSDHYPVSCIFEF